MKEHIYINQFFGGNRPESKIWQTLHNQEWENNQTSPWLGFPWLEDDTESGSRRGAAVFLLTSCTILSSSQLWWCKTCKPGHGGNLLFVCSLWMGRRREGSVSHYTQNMISAMPTFCLKKATRSSCPSNRITCIGNVACSSVSQGTKSKRSLMNARRRVFQNKVFQVLVSLEFNKCIIN